MIDMNLQVVPEEVLVILDALRVYKEVKDNYVSVLVCDKVYEKILDSIDAFDFLKMVD